MTTINPNGANINPAAKPASNPATDRRSPTIQTTLNRLGRALTIRGAVGDQAGPANDSVQISTAATSASRGGGAQGIADIGVLLADLESLVAQAAQDNAGADVRAEAQRRIDEAVATISRIAGADSVGEVGSRLNGAPGYSVVNRLDEVGNVVVDSDLKKDERVDLDLDITQSGQAGGLYLSFGGPTVDLKQGLQSGGVFVIEVAGNLDRRELSFGPDTLLSDVAAAINALETRTGVQAVASGTGIRIQSSKFGADEFVSVKIINDGTIESGDGIFTLLADDARAATTTAATAFNTPAAAEGIVDTGQDLMATINGVQAQVSENTISVALLGGRLDVAFDLNVSAESLYQSYLPGKPKQLFTVFGGRGDPGRLSEQSGRIENIRIENRALGRGESFGVDIEVTQPAERAGVFVIFDQPNVNEQLESLLTISIAGVDGEKTLTFLSGQSLQSVAAAISDQSDQTGVEAKVSSGALRIQSTELGDDQFVSLEVLDAGKNAARAGQIGLSQRGGADPQGRGVLLSSLAANQSSVEDAGKDLLAVSDGYEITSRGRRVVGDALDGLLHFEFDFVFGFGRTGEQTFGAPPNRFSELTPFRVFTINGADSYEIDGPPVGEVPFPGSSPASQALTPFTTAGVSSGDFVAALDAIRSLRGRLGGGVTNETLADLRRDLITRAGAALDITAPSDAQQALDLLGGATP